MSWRTKGYYQFLLKFNRHEAIHNLPLAYNPQSWSVWLDVFLPPKPPLYIWKKQSYVVYNLNHVIMASISLNSDLELPISDLALLMWQSKGDLYTPENHSKVLQPFIYVRYGCEKDLKLVYSLNHEIPHSIIYIRQWPRIAKIWPSLGYVAELGCTHMPMDIIERC